MTVIKAERPAETEQAAAATAAAVEQVEGEIRAFVRRDLSVFRRRQQESGDATVDSIGSVIERVSSASVGEIERVMAELANVRDMLRGDLEGLELVLRIFAADERGRNGPLRRRHERPTDRARPASARAADPCRPAW